MEFRKAKWRDLESLRTIASESEAHWGYDQAYMDKFNSTYNITAEFLKQHPVYVGFEDDGIRCFWGIMSKGKGWELEYFYISRACIGNGYGRLMWLHFTDWCKEQKLSNVEWVTSPQAAGFYQKMGALRQEEVCSSLDGRLIPRFELDNK